MHFRRKKRKKIRPTAGRADTGLLRRLCNRRRCSKGKVCKDIASNTDHRHHYSGENAADVEDIIADAVFRLCDIAPMLFRDGSDQGFRCLRDVRQQGLDPAVKLGLIDSFGNRQARAFFVYIMCEQSMFVNIVVVRKAKEI